MFSPKAFCETFNLMRKGRRKQAIVLVCVLMGQQECVFESGQGGWKDWALTFDPFTGNISTAIK